MLVVRAAGERDDGAREELHRECFGFSPPAGTFAWKYRGNAHGRAIELVACDGEEVIAAYALVPRVLKVEGERVLAFQAADAMTARRHRRRGCFTRMQAGALEEARAHGGAYLFAFSGRESVDHFERAGYASVGAYEEWVHRWSRWRRAAASAGTWRAIAPEEATFDENAEGIAGRRDESFLRWRVGSAPGRLHAVLVHEERGWHAVVERFQECAALADLWPRDAWEGAVDAWRSLLDHLRAQGVEDVRMTLFDKEPSRDVARRAGFRRRRRGSALPFMVRSIVDVDGGLPACWRASGGLWMRDLDRDAEGLLMRRAVVEG